MNVDEYLDKAQKWQKELQALRSIILDCGLNETLKWGEPCYTFQKGNVVLIHGFKEYCAIMFFKGALLYDQENILVQQTENAQATRQIRFTSIQEIMEKEAVLKAYIFEAIEIEKAGLKVVMKKTLDFIVPVEFQTKLDENSTFKTAFESLTPGRQRAYNLYFSTAKQSKTRESRVEEYRQRIMNGKGINDCVCGLSKRMPTCDGSHKYIKSKS